MPFVQVFWRRSLVKEPTLTAVVEALPQIVAATLTGEEKDAKLAPQDVEVSVAGIGPYDHFGDPKKLSLAIIVDAADFPSRRANLDERRKAIIARLKLLLPLKKKVHGFVWVRLMPSSFGNF